MRILIVSPFFPPQNSIASLRPYSFAKFWKEQGHSIDILTTKKENEVHPLDLPIDFVNLIEVPLPQFFTQAKKNNINPTHKKSFLINLINTLRFKKGILNACRMPDITDIWAYRALKVIK